MFNNDDKNQSASLEISLVAQLPTQMSFVSLDLKDLK